MATSILTPSHAHHGRSLSTSGTPAHYSSPADASSIINTLPSIDFGFDDLKSRMAAFTHKFDAFIEKSRRQVLDDRNTFRARMGELREEQTHSLHSLRALQSTHRTQQSLLATQSAELADLHSTISTISSRRDTLASARERTKARIEDAKRQIERKLELQREYARKFDGMKGRDGPEVGFWEEVLGLRIESAGWDGGVRVGFWNLVTGKSGGQQGGSGGKGMEAGGEAWFELDCGREYRLGEVRPKLRGEGEEGEARDALRRLNEDGEIGPFLKRMRGVLVDVVGRREE
ncbi:MAG: hypothetical protein Q9227_006488 [Pyrenula ochraceoflavens]